MRQKGRLKRKRGRNKEGIVANIFPFQQNNMLEGEKKLFGSALSGK
jgi:hypothetical protein